MTALSLSPTFKLNNGVEMPLVGIGCFMGERGAGARCEQMVKLAVKTGYRHFDTATLYENEEAVGKAIRESDVPRKELFVTTKLPGTSHHAVRDGFESSLKKLGLEYIDLYLMHFPIAFGKDGAIPPDQSPTFVEVWQEMEKLLETGKVRAIGVSNFSIKNLEILLPHAKVIPVTNQVEMHPCYPQNELKKYCEEKGILLTAYSPFGQPGEGNTVPFFIDPTFSDLAKKYDAAVGQILISWAVQRGTAVIPKSEKVERMQQMLSLVKLAPADMKALDDFHKKPDMHRSLLATRYHVGTNVFGWSYEQMGWNMREGGFVVD